MTMRNDQLGKLIKYLPGWRLVILVPTNDLTQWSYEHEEFENPENTMFIYNDTKEMHYVYCVAPQQWFRTFKNAKDIRFCKLCLRMYREKGSIGSKCECKGATIKGKKTHYKKQCSECNQVYWSHNKHMCYKLECSTCSFMHQRNDGVYSRCPVTSGRQQQGKKLLLGKDDDNTSNEDNVFYDLIAWDIESATHLIEDEYTIEFAQDENGDFIVDDIDELPVDSKYTYNKEKQYRILRVEKTTQIPNLICTESVYTGEKHKFTTIREFLQWATCEHNNGNNIFVAHNSSGYDSRLLFEEGMKFDTKIKPTMNGGRIMTMQIGKATFKDSMLHLPGSLSVLGKGFGVESVKGYFPHLLNQEKYYTYVGSIPDKKYFDLSFTVKSEKDLVDFNEWYNNWEGEWNFQHELVKYCENDVHILATIMRKYSDTYTQLIGDRFPHLSFSPWFSATCAGYVHQLFLNHIHNGVDFNNMNHEEFQEYVQNTWAVLEPSEYYFARQALRGGSTNIYAYKYDGKIRYKDIQSSYPSVQLEHDYPVGTPTIHVFKKEQYPCGKHFSDPKIDCECSMQIRSEKTKRLNIKTHYEISDYNSWVKGKFGFAMVDLEPPKTLYHPPIIRYDNEKKKCIESLERIEKQTITSVELEIALANGYSIIQLYRFDEYKKAPSLWRELLGHMYILKMRYSQKPPDKPTQTRMKETFKYKFGIDLGDMDTWEKNPILKKICKGPPTSAWGKHAETVDHPQTVIIDENNPEAAYEFLSSLQLNKNIVTSCTIFDTKTMYNVKENRTQIRPNCHRGYLPCAVFVTAYGRLKLWKEKQKLGTRVLMCDTDSIVYIDDKNGYDIPEGDCLGDWETEDFERENGGIIGFRACGPKSYSLKASNGAEYTKCKGVSLKRAHRSLINFEVMDEMVTKKRKVNVPQMAFDYTIGKGISTRKFIKQVGFNKAFIKGVYKEDEYRVYPYGFQQ